MMNYQRAEQAGVNPTEQEWDDYFEELLEAEVPTSKLTYLCEVEKLR